MTATPITQLWAMDVVTFQGLAEACGRVDAAHMVQQTHSRFMATNAGFAGKAGSKAIQNFLAPYVRRASGVNAKETSLSAAARAGARVVETDVDDLALQMAHNHPGIFN